ncbi:putative glycosyltransferase 6 domain-containing protein 1 [Callorhinchus milii]|uniref:Globoside alpha-1,3-N-acetylgalactosaminyltransferase 1-like protein n=1 Tax=Callorhinchus milii TaxID=7868 RepID=K4G5J0_CALMI|nr:putative glycosyltransferase 6 domain-containing protein 1 [Callorhinchus milii]AFM87614.1 globoside alpha-1,3-N-acetylgalactosaminyltransferase 1-like protein [Callorhinchus milii]
MGRLAFAARLLSIIMAAIILLLLSLSYLRNTEPALNTEHNRPPALVRKIQRNGPQTLIEVEQPFALKAPRTDVMLVTPWLAPIIWEGSFDQKLLDATYKPLNFTIGMTLFAVAKYTRFLKPFLESAEKHFMQGYRVNYYIFTDIPEQVPRVELKPGRSVVVFNTVKYSRWQEISLRRMEIINKHIMNKSIREVDYLYCLDVDLIFTNHYGAETFAPLVAVLHPGYFNILRNKFPYERRPESQAYVPKDHGHFYYIAAMFGGTLNNIVDVTAACHQALQVDKVNGIEAAWQEESHLNKYLVTNMPHKIPSMEYLCNSEAPTPASVKVCRFSTVKKNHAEIRAQK